MSKQTDLINIPDAITVSGSNVGIGTTSPSAKLDIQQATAGNIVSAEFDNTDYTANNRNAIKIRQQNAANSSFSTFLGNDRATGNVFLSNDSITADHLVIDSSGNVGIGTTSITSFSNIPNLTVGGSSGGMLTNQVNGTDGMRLYSNSSGTVLNETRNLFLQFATNNTERMRIDSSGNLLVGKTSTGGNVAGHQFNSNGAGYITRDGASVLHVNRKTSDGEIISIRKDDVAVGSIGVVSDDRMYFATADGLGLQFDKDNNRIIPCDASGGYNSNVELGDEGLAFTNLFLTGGIQFDSRSNKLDDYEEGTWTPLAKGTSTNPTVAPTLIGRYTKIGNQVNIYLKFDAKSFAGASGGVYFDGLPFSASGATVHGIGSIMQYNVCTFNDSPCLYVSGSAVYIYHNVSGGTWDNSAHTGSSAVYMNACVTYTTNS
jgi:hypothetical protein